MVPYHPASNGVAERMIGVLTSAARAMLHDAGLPKSLWAEAYNTATFVRNRSLTAALEGRTPYEIVRGTKPDVSDLRAFGAPCAVVKAKEKLKKLDDRARMCMFIGYKYGGESYRVWDPRGSTVVETRDVSFFEEGLPSPTYHDLATRPRDDAQTLGPDHAPDEPLSTIPPRCPPQMLPRASS